MSLSLFYLRRGLLGIAVAGSLGFGASHAFAVPMSSGSSQGCPYCTTYCQDRGYEAGVCRSGYPGNCFCYYL